MSLQFDCFPGGLRKAITLSYDDGQIHDRRLMEIMNHYNIRGTFHLNSGKLDSEKFLTANEIKKLFAGHEVSVHTVTHPRLETLPDDLIVKEILEDRKALENLVDYPVRGMSFPYGSFNDRVLALLPALGIEYSRTVTSTQEFGIPNNLLTWSPTCHHKNNLSEILDRFLAPLPPQVPQYRLLYVWGHSYEFERDNNWNVIEDFCSKAGRHNDIWYATNIEIADYIRVFRAASREAE